MKKIGMLLFDGVEILDFAGPYEVFSVTRNSDENGMFEVSTISKNGQKISARNGLSINVDYSISNAPSFDIFIIPGGFGTRPLLNDKEVLSWIKETYENTDIVMTVCSGSLLLGKLGILGNRPFCTHYMAYKEMEEIAPLAEPQKDKRFVQSGKLYTSAGISAGIDLAFHLLEKLHGKEMAIQTAKHMEYRLVE